MLEIKTWRDPYEEGFSPTKPTKIEFNDGITVLVGCNGTGKSTLLKNIKAEMNTQNIPCYLYDNCNDGGANAVHNAFMQCTGGFGGFEQALLLTSSSEGEAIKINMNSLCNLYMGFLKDGFMATEKNCFSRVLSEKSFEITTNKRVLLFDAIDSGLSVDGVIEIKNLFEQLLNKASEINVELYIIISANEYELARQSECFDVNTGKYIYFKTYESYRKFIIKSRIRKEKRIDKQIEYRKKKRLAEEKKYYKLVETNTTKINKIKEKTKTTYRDKWRIEELEREIRDSKPDWIEE